MKVKDCVEILDDKRIPLSSSQREKLEKKYRYYGAQGVIDYVDDYIFDGEYILVAEDGNNLKSLNENIATWATGKFWVNNHAHILGPKKGTNLKYVYYLINNLDLRGYITGSAQPKLNQENLANIELLLPVEEVQNKVANILSAIDKQIENNNKINSELESLAKTIYDYWFLQFEFPNEEGKPYKSSGGKLVWNEELKREIPEGWNSLMVGDILGNYPKTTSVQKEDYNTQGKYPIIDQSKDFICGYTDDNDKVLSLNDVIVYGDHTNTVKYVNFDFARGADGTQIINSNSANIPNCLLYQQIKDLPIIEKGYSRHFKFVKAQHILVPTNNIAVKYADLMSNIYKDIAVAICENKELASLRDFLLPMLMNGQVTFKEVK